MTHRERLSPPTREALMKLVARFGLSPTLGAPLCRLVELLAGDPLAPTAVRDPGRILDDHLADSLVALDLAAVRSARRVVDIGSGAGLPGLPLALALPATGFTLLESNHRKAGFLSRAVKECELSNVTVVSQRAESWRAGIGVADVVTVRAVADLDVVAEYAAPLLRVGGSLVAWRGRRNPEAEARAARAAGLLGLEVLEPSEVQPFPDAQHRHLHLMVKVRDTPGRFPRRPGVAEKRPLGVPR
jgi:16S rRNA (guanine527-N7)-methyltransferase